MSRGQVARQIRIACRIRARWGLAFPVLLALVAASLAVSADADAAKRKKGKKHAVAVSGTVRYEKRDCFSGPARRVPLAEAEVFVKPKKGRGDVGTLDRSGRFRLRVSGERPYRGFVTLEGERLSVRPHLKGGRPYRIKLGKLDPGRSYGSNKIFLSDLAEAGAASIWSTLNEGAALASQASPVRIQPIRALWRYKGDLKTWIGNHTPSQYNNQPDSPEIYVGGKKNGTFDDRFEAFPLLHEYGHHVLTTVANPGEDSTGKHSFTSVHPDNPALPWSEGFAHAFAAIVTKAPQQTLGCKPVVNLAAQPATPKSQGDPWLNQYHEMSIAGAVWGVVGHLGGGDPHAGLKRLLQALNTFHSTYGGPESLREARDALIVGGAEGSEADYRALTTVFNSQKIRWGLGAGIAMNDFRNEGVSAFYEVKLVLDGPYGECQLSSDVTAGYTLAKEGGLPYVSGLGGDDCMMLGGDGKAPLGGASGGPNIVFAALELGLPYLSGEAHNTGEFMLSATWACKDNPQTNDPGAEHPEIYRCTQDREFHFDLQHGFRYESGAQTADVRLTNGVSLPLLRFDAAGGECQILPTGEDCSV